MTQSLAYHRCIQYPSAANYGVRYFRNYCTECEWEATTEETESSREVGERAVEHHCEFGHGIESLTIEYPAAEA